MRRFWAKFACLLVMGSFFTMPRAFGDDLAAAFKSPPASARPHTWWHWMNGRVSREGITADLEWMNRVGIGGVQAFHIADGFEPGPVKYLSAEWKELFRHAAAEADRLGLEMCLHNCAGWSSSGGPWITPEMAMQEVVWSEMRVDAGQTEPIVLKRPQTKVDFYRDIAIIAFPTPERELTEDRITRLKGWKAKAAFERKNRPTRDERNLPANVVIDHDAILDLSDKLSDDGKLNWQPASGTWTILRFGHTPTGQTNLPAPPEGRGLECDKLNPRAAELHWRHVVEPVLAELGPLAPKTLQSVLIDSYEARHQNWTPGFDVEFARRTGYDLRPWLPTLTGRVVENVDATERFLWDFRNVIGAMVAENYYAKFERMCHDCGLALAVEPYGYWGIFNDFEVARYGDLPMGEFWTDRPTAWFTPTTKFAASAAHAYGRPVVGAEAFTSGLGSAGWLNYPARLKALGDHYYCDGLNRVVFHTCVHQPWMNHRPGMTMWRWGMQMNRNNTLAEHLGPWLEYMTRSQYLLQQGEFVADLCYLADEDTPNSLGPRASLQPAPPAGYDYDALAASATKTMEVRDGRVVLPSGMSYRALVLPSTERMSPELLADALRLADSGATIIAAKRPPASPGLQGFPECDSQVKQRAAELWNQERFVAASSADELALALAKINLPPDFECRDAKVGVDLEFIHRRVDGADVYFVSNQRNVRLHCRPTFRVAGKTPEIWQPQSGDVEPAVVWRSRDDGQTEVELQLEPMESVFVVFRDGDSSAIPIVAIDRADAIELDEPRRPSVIIDEAIYGCLAGKATERADVTELVRFFARDGRCRVPATNYLAKDPAPNLPKHLLVRYRIDGQPHEDVVPENKWWQLDAAPHQLGPPSVRLRRNGNQSALVTYQSGRFTVAKSDGDKQTLAAAALPPARIVDGPWQVRFEDLPKHQQESFPQLISWSDHANDDIRHYSGTSTYRIAFDLSAAECASDMLHWLDLGDVRELASLRINDSPPLPLWKPPFAAEVSRWTRSGANELTITVTNLWANRLIGDERFPADYEIDRTGTMLQVPAWLEQGLPRPSRDRHAVATFKHWSVDDQLLPSGLLGPVTLYFGRNVPVPKRTGSTAAQ